jgi:hypothetical protein
MADLSSRSPDRLTEELQKLYELFQSGAINADEYARAKLTILGAADVGTTQAAAHLQLSNEVTDIDTQVRLLRVEMENALLRADRSWDQVRESMLTYPRNARSYESSNTDTGWIDLLFALIGPQDASPREPSGADVGWAIFLSVICIAGAILLMLGAERSVGNLLLAFGCIVIAIVVPIDAKVRLSNFQEAEEAYCCYRSRIYDQYQKRIQELQSQRP